MRFKVGDKVTIRHDLNMNMNMNLKLSIVPDMVAMAGQVKTIESIDEDGDFELKEDGDKWSWTEDMFEPNKLKGEEDYMKILELWKNEREEAIREKYNKEMADVKDKDEILAEVKKIAENLKTLNEKIKKETGKRIYLALESNVSDALSIDTVIKLDELNIKRRDEEIKLNALFKEITARLELCESEASKIEVLKNYNVLDKSGKLKREEQ